MLYINTCMYVCEGARGQKFLFKMFTFTECGNMDGTQLLFELSKHCHVVFQQELQFLDLSLYTCSKRYLQWMSRGWRFQQLTQSPHNPLELLFWHQSTHWGAFGTLQLNSYSQKSSDFSRNVTSCLILVVFSPPINNDLLNYMKDLYSFF